MTPYELVRRAAAVQDATKAELVRLSRQLERAALLAPPPAAAATLQDERYLTDRTRSVYAALAAAGAPSRLHARGMHAWLAPGVRGVALDDDDPLVDEWVVVLPGHEPVVLAATDLQVADQGEAQRTFSYGLSHDRDVVQECGRLLGI